MKPLHPLLFLAMLTPPLAAVESSPPPAPPVPAPQAPPPCPPAVPSLPPPSGGEQPERKRPDGGVPAKAAEFHGVIEGAVETVSDRHVSFKIKITKATPSDKSKAVDPSSLVCAVVKVRRDYVLNPEGRPAPCPGHSDYMASLKPGDIIKVNVGYSKSTNSLKLTEVSKR